MPGTIQQRGRTYNLPNQKNTKHYFFQHILINSSTRYCAILQTVIRAVVMSIIKSLVFTVVFAVQVTNAEFYVNCLASPNAEPDALVGGCNTLVREEVLIMLGICTGLDMAYAVLPSLRRGLGSPEQRQNNPGDESKRELMSCYDTDLNSGNQQMCCMQDSSYHYCAGSPKGDRRLEEDTSEADMCALYSEQCTTAFQALADAYTTASLAHCLGPSDKVFCRCFTA